MTEKERTRLKHARIVMYYDLLGKSSISHDASVKFLSYMFGVTERYLEIAILCRYKMSDFTDITIEHRDIDMKIIECYIQKLLKNGKNYRKNV